MKPKENEAMRTFEKYILNQRVSLNFFGEDDEANYIAQFISQGEYLKDDYPDMLIKYGDEILLIEHFEFDCYENKRKGSVNRQEQARIERKFDKVPNNQEGVHSHDTIKGVSSYVNYIANVSNAFKSHYPKLDDYITNLKSKNMISNKKVIKMFLIEDTSPLGTVVYDEKPQPVILAMSKEFLTLVKSSPNIDYVLACSNCNSHNYVWLISQKYIDDYIVHSIDYASMSFADFTPHVRSFKIEIPKEQLEENNDE